MNIIQIKIISNKEVSQNIVIPKSEIETVYTSKDFFVIGCKSKRYFEYECYRHIKDELNEVLIDIMKCDKDILMELYYELCGSKYMMKYVSYSGNIKKQIIL